MSNGRAVWGDAPEPRDEESGSESERRVGGMGSQDAALTENLGPDYGTTRMPHGSTVPRSEAGGVPRDF